MKLRNAFYLAQDGEYIKSKGDRWNSQVGWYRRLDIQSLEYSTDAWGEVITGDRFKRWLLKSNHPVYGIYTNHGDFNPVDVTGRSMPTNILDRDCTYAFWGASSICSNFHPAEFKAGGVVFPTVEHYMMFMKAKTFNDDDAALKILKAKHPARARELGRSVRGYVDDTWRKCRVEHVYQGKLYQAQQHDYIREFYLEHHGSRFVEASPLDRVWGVGLDLSHPDLYDSDLWRGQNLLGNVCERLTKTLYDEAKQT